MVRARCNVTNKLGKRTVSAGSSDVVTVTRAFAAKLYAKMTTEMLRIQPDEGLGIVRRTAAENGHPVTH
jgi:hypothetical protein